MQAIKLLIISAMFLSGRVTAQDCDIEDQKKSEREIFRLIEQANYCEVDADCKHIDVTCPFGCLTAVNKNEAEKIKMITEKHLKKYI